jgi:hypothetical protein
MALLARCPDCGGFQVSVFDVDSRINLKCPSCGRVFRLAGENASGSGEAVDWSLAVSLREYEFEQPQPLTANLVVVQNLPSIYPHERRTDPTEPDKLATAEAAIDPTAARPVISAH